MASLPANSLPIRTTIAPSLPSSDSTETGSRRLRTLSIPGPAGALEGLLSEGSADSPCVALVCHPHPLGGGNMHNKVVYHAAKTLESQGIPVLRFNFRSVGRSEGRHHGSEETEDVRAALDWLESAFHRPILAAGFSFGAATGLRAACGDGRVVAFAALGLPTQVSGREYDYSFLHGCSLPRLLLSGTRDEYATPAELTTLATAAPLLTTLRLVPDADHFFTGHLDAMRRELDEWLGSQMETIARASAASRHLEQTYNPRQRSTE